MRPIVVHISSDYPDPLVPDKTRAVKALVDGTEDDFEHHVYSLNRVDGWSGISSLTFGQNKTAIAYHALPKGLFWEPRLRDVANWIEADLRAKNITPDLIEAHKFTVEGLIGQQLSNRFNKPLVCDIQGDTDTNILKKKPGLRARYKQIAQKARVVFPFAPWPLKTFKDLIELDGNKCRLLPVVPGIDVLKSSPVIAESKLITVFNADSWKRKNISSVIEAMKILLPRFPDLTLDVYGRGKPSSLMAMTKMIETSGIADRVHLKGMAENGRLPEIMNGYAAFVQPSLRESYGLVYAEALFAGIPVLFSKDRGIDGYLPTHEIGYAADPHSVTDIANGIAYLLTKQSDLKTSIARLQTEGGLDILRKANILKIYREGLLAALVSQG